MCDPIDGNPPGSAVPGILQARTVEWVAISFPNAWRWKVKVKLLSPVWLWVTPWTAAYQAPPSMGFSRQEYWSRVPLPSPLGHAGFSNYNMGFISCGSQTPESRPKSYDTQAYLLQGMWDLPGPGIEPVSPVLAGGFFTTQPPGKPSFTLQMKK